MTVCTLLPEVGDVWDVTFSLPHLPSDLGILVSLPYSVDEAETAKLRASTQAVCEAIKSFGL